MYFNYTKVFFSERGKELIIYQNYKFSFKELTKKDVSDGVLKEVGTLNCTLTMYDDVILKEITKHIISLLKTFNGKSYKIR